MESLAKKKIIVIDDHEPTRRGLVDMFEDTYDVDSAKDGSEGLFKIMNTKYDLVITDNNMPYLSGVDMVEFFDDKNVFLNNDTKFIMITANWSGDEKERGKKAGVNYWMMKPYNILKLYKICMKILDPHSSKFL
ncbi:MAG: response regulator [Bdellovibrionota bacterium]|nr:response regulator [Bdellovibrionota bacterium]MEC8625198.1 response regulator [Bdellovibrionota bacterium]